MTDTTFTYKDKEKNSKRLLSYGDFYKKNQEEKADNGTQKENQGE